MSQNNQTPPYPMLPPADVGAATTIANSRPPRVIFSLRDAPDGVDPTAPGPSQLPPNTVNIRTFMNAAENTGFTPTVIAQVGLPAIDLQTGAATTIPRDTRLILGRIEANAPFHQIAPSTSSDFTYRVEQSDLLNGGVYLDDAAYNHYKNGTGEGRSEGFVPLEQLYVMQLSTFRSITGEVTLRPGTTVCHGVSPTPGVAGSSLLRAVVTDRITGVVETHYIVITQAGAQELLNDVVLRYADGTMAARIPGFQDYTPADEDVPAGQEPHTASQAFDACGETCQTVHIGQGEVYEARYRQNGDISGTVTHYCKLSTGELFVGDEPTQPAVGQQAAAPALS